MIRRWLGGLVGLMCLAPIGYTVSIVAATPEEMIRRPFTCPDESKTEAKEFQVLTVRKWSEGMVALYRGNCLDDRSIRFSKDQKPQPMLSYRVAKRNGMEWNLVSSGSYFTKASKTANTKKLIEYGVGRTNTKDKQRHAVFYGEILEPTVAAVEVTFNNGKVLRDRGVDGMLLLVAPGATGICDVRALGIDNQILQRDELIPVNTTAVNNTCQPISGQL
ncbi:hypothetical protein [Leptolyngbya sp. NIES-2104]|uniref:hypothetical protein n=1 Tax=Leptolyngbya sp. NIES-2104 TaxID=1552121 RepID=UPI0006EC4D70|nr:hypothetical protein [Leptolyngbya sp. NIES-2104]GAP98939.1 hypothetical protein NIES2104_54960 [Leptolyngbya sp. NIES-2104]